MNVEWARRVYMRAYYISKTTLWIWQSASSKSYTKNVER
jgi:hypothetical protein